MLRMLLVVVLCWESTSLPFENLNCLQFDQLTLPQLLRGAETSINQVLTGIVSSVLTPAGGSGNTCSGTLTSATCPNRNGLGRVRIAQESDLALINTAVSSAPAACSSAVRTLTCEMAILNCPSSFTAKFDIGVGLFLVHFCNKIFL